MFSRIVKKKKKNAESSQTKALLWLNSIYSYYRNISRNNLCKHLSLTLEILYDYGFRYVHLVSTGNQNQNILFTPEQIRWSQLLQDTKNNNKCGKVPILNNTLKKKKQLKKIDTKKVDIEVTLMSFVPWLYTCTCSFFTAFQVNNCQFEFF